MSVSASVLEHGGDEDLAIAALLHDAVEDSADGAAMFATITERFGQRVGDVVMACSDWVAIPGTEKAPWRERKGRYLQHLESADADVLLVSACDKLHNSRAILADLIEIGNRLWERFSTRSGSDQVWYYRKLCEAYEGRIPRPLELALDEVVDQVAAVTAELGTNGV